MSRRYCILDVFTEIPLEGNPLAVVTEADGLDSACMQAIAREFNLSETVFVLPPDDARHRARLRIFTPSSELPFAGHPTVGAAVLLALLDGRDTPAAFGLEENVGVLPCIVEPRGARAGYGRFRLPRLPETLGRGLTPADAARAVGLDPGAIGFAAHVPSRRAVGPAFDLIPVASLKDLARAQPSPEFGAIVGGDHPAVYLYAPSPAGLQARMFAPGLGVFEDPATGSAAACLAGALADHEGLADGRHEYVIRQGVEMGRPSRIDLELTLEGGALASGEIGGGAVIVADGALHA